jgi:DNA-binding beta-propeller fold protein YncE
VSASVGSSPGELREPRGLAVDEDARRALVVDRRNDELVEISIGSGNRRVLADATTRGSGELDQPVALALFADGLRAVVVNRGDDSLVGVDLDSGEIELLSGGSRGDGPAIQRPVGVVLDEEGGRALVAIEGSSSRTILAVRLANGERSVVSGTNVGTGPLPGEPTALTVDQNGILLLADESEQGSGGLIAIEPGSGDRILISR